MIYYGTRLSENISRREPEGYLICLNVPVARSGTQDYLPEELGLPPGPGPIPVYRPEEEVFSEAARASFEGMPVTDNHPAEGVDAHNIRQLQKGHAHNVRRGTGDQSDLLLADLLITDPFLIDEILNQHKREISCGYTYDLCEESGHYIQRKIRGNHIAVVDQGRAGPRVSIRDHLTKRTERSTPMKKTPSPVSLRLARMAKDTDETTFAEILENILDPEAPAPVTIEPEEPAAVEVPEGHEITIDDFSAILERLDRLIELLTPAATDEDPAPETPAHPSDPISEAVEEAVSEAVTEAVEDIVEEVVAEAEEILDPAAGEISDPVLSAVLEATEDECGEEDPLRPEAADAIRAAVKAVRPALARMPKAQRAKVAADIAARIRRNSSRDSSRKSSGTYAALASRSRSADRKTSDPGALGRKIMASRNVNYRK